MVAPIFKALVPTPFAFLSTFPPIFFNGFEAAFATFVIDFVATLNPFLTPLKPF